MQWNSHSFVLIFHDLSFQNQKLSLKKKKESSVSSVQPDASKTAPVFALDSCALMKKERTELLCTPSLVK